jgi:hypothetical protein
VVLENHYSDLSNLGGYPVDLKLLKRDILERLERVEELAEKKVSERRRV